MYKHVNTNMRSKYQPIPIAAGHQQVDRHLLHAFILIVRCNTAH